MSADYVRTLTIRQLPSHLPLQPLLARLPYLESLELTYGNRFLDVARYTERTPASISFEAAPPSLQASS